METTKYKAIHQKFVCRLLKNELLLSNEKGCKEKRLIRRKNIPVLKANCFIFFNCCMAFSLSSSKEAKSVGSVFSWGLAKLKSKSGG